MRCLLCKINATNTDELFQHYVNVHQINKTNYYFKKLFEKDGNSCFQTKCFKYKHIFHKTVENNLINILKRSSFLTIYSINLEQHSEFYNFFNSEQNIDDFLTW